MPFEYTWTNRLNQGCKLCSDGRLVISGITQETTECYDFSGVITRPVRITHVEFIDHKYWLIDRKGKYSYEIDRKHLKNLKSKGW